MTQATLVDFDVQRADVTIQANFAAEFWPLFHNIPAFYSALLIRLRDVGLTSNAIKTDVGDGSLGGYNVNFWLFDIRALVRIRLERLDIEFRSILQADVDLLERAVVGVLEALRSSMSSSSNFEIANYWVDVQLHGEPSGIPVRGYLSRFVSDAPSGLGPLLGSGCVFYFGEQSAAPVKTVTVDLSAAFPGKLYVRLATFFQGSTRPEALRAAVEEHMATGLAAIGLRRVRNQRASESRL